MISQLEVADTELLFSSQCISAKIDCYKQIAYHLCKAARYYLAHLNKMLGLGMSGTENLLTLLRAAAKKGFSFEESKILFMATINSIANADSEESYITYNDVIQLRINVTELRELILQFLDKRYRQNMLTELKIQENEPSELQSVKQKLISQLRGD